MISGLFFNIGITPINFHVSTALAASQLFLCFVFIFIHLKAFSNFLFFFFFDCVLFTFQVFLDFLNFLHLFLISFQCVRKHTLHDFNHFNLLRFVLWTNRWSTLENTACTLEKNVYLAVVGWVFYRCLLVLVSWSCH